jgi:group I intron endonuclease
MAYVYLITNKVNGKKYIGSSRKDKVDPEYYGSGRLITNALKKYGSYNFTREILWEGEGDARGVETRYLIEVDAANNPNYYNLTNDARGNDQHSEEHKLTISEKLTGRKLSKTTCRKISEAKKGRPTRKKGKPDGSKPGVTKAHTGRISPNRGKGNPILQYDLEGNYISEWNNINEAISSLNLQISNESIRQCLKGKSKKSAGYVWEYKW